MAQGGGHARRAAGLGATLLCLLIQLEVAHAATYAVGTEGGWTLNLVSWPDGKHFTAHDVLVFVYNPMYHNVVAVNSEGYNSCKTPMGSKVYQTGNDRITIAKGLNYFICNFPGHCEAGMKIAVNAE